MKNIKQVILKVYASMMILPCVAVIGCDKEKPVMEERIAELQKQQAEQEVRTAEFKKKVEVEEQRTKKECEKLRAENMGLWWSIPLLLIVSFGAGTFMGLKTRADTKGTETEKESL